MIDEKSNTFFTEQSYTPPLLWSICIFYILVSKINIRINIFWLFASQDNKNVASKKLVCTYNVVESLILKITWICVFCRNLRHRATRLLCLLSINQTSDENSIPISLLVVMLCVCVVRVQCGGGPAAGAVCEGGGQGQGGGLHPGQLGPGPAHYTQLHGRPGHTLQVCSSSSHGSTTV